MAVPLTLSSVPAQTPYVQYIATASQTVFPYPFEITQDSDLVCLINGVQQATDGGYTLSGQGNTTGGFLTFTVGQTAGTIITLYRNIVIARITQFAQNGTFFSANFNNEFNRIYLIMQQLQESLLPGGNSAFALMVPNSNSPQPTTLLTPANYAGKYLSFDSNGNPTPALLTSSGSITGTLIAGLLVSVTDQAPIAGYAQSAAEIAANVTPSNYIYLPGDIRRYGAVLDGVTDDTAAVQRWASIGGRLSFPVAQTALISSAVSLISNSTIDFVEGATISNATQNINMFQAASKSNIILRGATFLSTAATSATQVGGVYFTLCTNCVIENCSFSGMPFNGIWGSANSYCTLRGNRFSNSAGATTQDSGDINWTSSSTTTAAYNIIDGNYCYGGGEFGIAVWDPYSGVLPKYNVISNNRIGAQSGYGVLIYMPDAGDSYNQVIGNHIQDITGAIPADTSSGNGIYCTGAGLGGTLVANNTILNCCINTANASLAPAGIGFNSTSVNGAAPIVISGNVITGMTQYHGILVTGVNGAAITGNSVRMPSTQSTIGHAIAVVNSDDISVTGNAIVLLSTTQNQVGVFLEAIGANYSDVTIANNSISGGHYAQIRSVNDGQQYAHVSIMGNVCSNGDSSCIPLILESGSLTEAQIIGNTFPSANATAISQTACTNIRYSGNFVTGTGAVIVTSGACTGSFYDRTNFGSGAAGGVDNAGTGFIIEILGTGIPGAGTWAVGDTVRNSAPSASGVYEWVCTTAGTSGTWKTISNT